MLIAILLAGCSFPSSTTPQKTPVPVISTETPTPTNMTTKTPSSVLTLWLAPSFAPDSSTPAGTLLAERLTAFEQAHPGTTVHVRIKDEHGTSGLLETLFATSIAAPSNLPDVITLDPSALNAAILDGLASPLNEWINEPQAPEWYDYAIESSRIGGGFYGSPFASSTDALAYFPLLFSAPPLTWSDILEGPAPFLFPAGDPLASFTLTQYLALGGPIRDETGQTTFDPEILADVLTFYNAAHDAEILPASARQYTTAADTWAALRAERASSAVAPLSLIMGEGNLQLISALPLPTRSEPGTGLVETWSWAIATPDPDQQALAAQLIDWLNQPEFLGPWTHALKMLPPTATALSQWPDGPETALANSFVTIVQRMPSDDQVAILGPFFQSAVEAVLSEGETPTEAAQSALDSLMDSNMP
jgi:ABC-type glycerol-3-phosphate transport system substrate-binding protein